MTALETMKTNMADFLNNSGIASIADGGNAAVRLHVAGVAIRTCTHVREGAPG